MGRRTRGTTKKEVLNHFCVATCEFKTGAQFSSWTPILSIGVRPTKSCKEFLPANISFS